MRERSCTGRRVRYITRRITYTTWFRVSTFDKIDVIRNRAFEIEHDLTYGTVPVGVIMNTVKGDGEEYVTRTRHMNILTTRANRAVSASDVAWVRA